MNKTATISARIEPKLKRNAENILAKIGLSSTDAIRLFYNQICLCHGLPFEVKIPNKATLVAMHEADNPRTNKAENVSSIFKEI